MHRPLSVPVQEEFHFGAFSFPVLQGISYQADGPDKQHPDRLFIADQNQRFLLYFEADGSSIGPARAQASDYGTLEYTENGKLLRLRYPLQQRLPALSVGYFAITFEDCRNAPCIGSLQIAPPVSYREGLLQHTKLQSLFSGLHPI